MCVCERERERESESERESERERERERWRKWKIMKVRLNVTWKEANTTELIGEMPQSVPPTAARGLSQVSTLDSLMDALAASASLSSWQSCCRKVREKKAVIESKYAWRI